MTKLTKYTMMAAVAAVALTSATKTAWAEAEIWTNKAINSSVWPLATSDANDPQNDKLTFNAPLYIWGAGMNGSAKVHGQNVSVDLPFSDIYDHTDVSFLGYFEYAKPKFGFYISPLYMALQFDGNLPAPAGNHTGVNANLWVVEAAGFYQVWNHIGERPAGLYVLGGARYWNIHENVNVVGVGKAANTDWLIDPIVGLRFRDYVTQRISINTQADIGGFDLGQQTSRFSWTFTTSLSIDFTMIVVKFPSTAFIGWRQMNVQHRNGGDSINLNFSGPIIGLNCVLF